jgi:hypothetical protein
MQVRGMGKISINWYQNANLQLITIYIIYNFAEIIDKTLIYYNFFFIVHNRYLSLHAWLDLHLDLGKSTFMENLQ